MSEVAWSGIGGVIVGAAIYYFVDLIKEKRRREQEADDIAVGLYHEISDRAARCLNDYITPWEAFNSTSPPNNMTPERVSKFRPTEPVVYPLIAGRLGLIKPSALGPCLRFYFRLDAIRREIDGVVSDFSQGTNLMAHNSNRVKLVAQRFHESIPVALCALKALNVKCHEEIDKAASLSYTHVASTNKALRDLLEDKI